ncbi:MAG: imidazole glycerol phosphate synthase subunit HisH [Gammaproteobacteria bacterium]|jgi:glutamine amidotransferase|nr:imidazole glycerol phosphate synthase subunit HisH [Gammaproteobacteria bacterium]|tara:strand:+ start:2398 stop:3021 length:624 start_codon:yes stop_codon:yes gene_type:complete
MVQIVDYDAGNVRSVQRACKYVGIDAQITADPEILLKSDKVIFPGVGSAVSAVDTLQARGLDEALKEFYQSGKPLLGICLGLQITLEYTEEGSRDCLGLLEGACERFNFTDGSIKVPHIGWNEVEVVQSHPMLKNIRSGDEFYFVHSYFAKPSESGWIHGVTEYGDKQFASILARNNLFATQFHLEKSGELGLKLLAEFADWQGGSC